MAETLSKASKSLDTDASSEEWFWAITDVAEFELRATPSYVTSVACRGNWCRVDLESADITNNLVGELDLIADMTTEAGTPLIIKKGNHEKGRAVYFLSSDSH